MIHVYYIPSDQHEEAKHGGRALLHGLHSDSYQRKPAVQEHGIQIYTSLGVSSLDGQGEYSRLHRGITPSASSVRFSSSHDRMNGNGKLTMDNGLEQ